MGYIDDYIAGAEQSGTQGQEKVPESEPVSFGTRLLAAFKASDTGVENFLKSQYGPNRVARDESGELVVATGASPFLKIDSEGVDIGGSLQKEFGSDNVFKDKSGAYVIAPKTGFTKFDPKGFDVGDIADVAPIGTSLAAGALAAGFTGGASIPLSLLTLAAAEGGGEVVNQAIGAALPGEEDVSNLERIARVGINAGAGAAGPAIGKAISTGAKIVKGAVGEVATRAASKLIGLSAPQRQVAEEVGSNLGAKLSLGEASQNKTLLSVEGFLRRNPFTQGIFNEADEQKLRGLSELATKAKNALGSGTAEEASALAVKVHTDTLEKLNSIRQKYGLRDFGEVQRISGNAKIIPVDNTVAAIDGLIDDFSSFLSDSDSSSAVKYLESLKAKIQSRAGQNAGSARLTAREFQNDLSNWGKKAYDPRGIVEGVTNRKTEKKIAATIFDALNKDLDSAVASGGAKKPVTEALKKARANYREISASIQEIADNPLSQFELRPQDVAKSFFSDAKGATQAKQVLRFLDEQSPAAANELRSGILEEFMRGASKSTENALENTINPAAFYRINSASRGKLSAIFEGDTTANKAFQDLLSASKLLARKYGEGSPTQPLLAIGDLLQRTGAIIPAALGIGAYGATGDASDAAKGIGATVAFAFGTRALAKALVNPKTTRAYSTVIRAAANPQLYSGKPGQRAIKQAVTDIATFLSREDMLDKTAGERNAQLSAP